MITMCGTPVESAARSSKFGDGRQMADGKSGPTVVSGGGQAAGATVGASAGCGGLCVSATAATYAPRPAGKSISLKRAVATFQSPPASAAYAASSAAAA